MDDPLGYCLDVPGMSSNPLLFLDVWAHSCHGPDLPDQVFHYNMDGQGQINFLTDEFDLCLTANTGEPGSTFSFDACGADNQGFDMSDSGLLMLRDSDQCLAVRNMAEGGSQSEIGAGREIAPGDLMRTLELQTCGTVLPAFETWEAFLADGDVEVIEPTPENDESEGCVIPDSGPWPPCATGGATGSTPEPTVADCVIPPSGPWPPCATGGGSDDSSVTKFVA